jgi:ribosome maturation factor RimP
VDTKVITSKLLEIVEPVANGAGYELVDLAFVREQIGWVVRVFIDYLPGHGAPGAAVGLPDCEALSHELSPVLDVADPIPCAYSLEVSSPGIDRPLRTAEHFRRYLGQTAKVRLHEGVDGRRNFKGTLIAVTDTPPASEQADPPEAVVISVDGTEFQLPIHDVATARLVPDWDQLLGSGAGRSTS